MPICEKIINVYRTQCYREATAQVWIDGALRYVCDKHNPRLLITDTPACGDGQVDGPTGELGRSPRKDK